MWMLNAHIRAIGWGGRGSECQACDVVLCVAEESEENGASGGNKESAAAIGCFVSEDVHQLLPHTGAAAQQPQRR